MAKVKCECPTNAFVPKEREHQYKEEEKGGMNHKAGKCKGINNIKRYQRDEEFLNLCSCCQMFGDIKVNKKGKLIT